MATIRKRGNRWQALVRRQGHVPLTRTFTLKADAEGWARQREAEIERGGPQQNPSALLKVTLGSLLDRYAAEVSTTKKGCQPEVIRLRAMRRNAVADTTLDKLTASRLARFRDERLLKVAPGTVRRELSVLRHCLEVARKEWGVVLVANPMDGVSLPPPANARERRLEEGDAQKLAYGLRGCRNPLVVATIRFAIATGMRRGEILSFTWGDVSLSRRFVRLRDSKNGSPRSVPLSPLALRVLQGLPLGDAGALVFPMSPNALRVSWERLKRRSGIVDLRFHDLRHEAISRFFEIGLSVPEVALISGHRDPRMLARYTHLRPENVATRLSTLMSEGTDEGTFG